MPGKLRFFVDVPSPNNATAAVMRLEKDGTNIPITDDCGGLRQFFELAAELGCYDAEASGGGVGGTSPNGVDSAILFLGSPIDVPPLQKTYIDLGSLTLQVAHTGSYAIRCDSMMLTEIMYKGQTVLHPTATNQSGWIFKPRNELSFDLAGPVITASYVNLGSIIGYQGFNQRLVFFDHSEGPIKDNEGFVFTEPNCGDYGIVVKAAGQGFIGNPVDVWGAHAQKYACIDIGHGAALVGGGNMIRAIVNPEPSTGTGLDYWGKDDMVDIQINEGDAGIGWRGITLEAPSTGLNCRVGRNVTTNKIVQAAGAGNPSANIINGVSYVN